MPWLETHAREFAPLFLLSCILASILAMHQQASVDVEPALQVEAKVQQRPLVQSRAQSEALRDEYLSNCRNACVPVPPPLNATGTMPGTWRGPHKLNGGELLLLSNFDSHLWTYRDKRENMLAHCAPQPGFCVAMARLAPHQSSLPQSGGLFGDSFVGTICSNARQDTACFFDNLVYEGEGVKQLTVEQTLSTEFTQLVHPKDYSNECTMCHAGQNAFLIKPFSDLGRIVRNMDGYQDFAQPDGHSPGPRTGYKVADFGKGASPWPMAPMMAFAPGLESACASCHALPAINTGFGKLSSYCNAILRPSAQTAMPPCDPHEKNCKGSAAGWHKVNPARPDPAILPIYAQSISRLRAECGDDN